MSTTTLAGLTGLSVASVSRRRDSALNRLKYEPDLEKQIGRVIKQVKYVSDISHNDESSRK